MYDALTGTFVSLMPSCLGQIGPTHSLGARSGTCYLLLGLAGLFGPPIGGAVLGPHNDRWWPLMVYSGAVALTGTASLAIARMVAGHGRLWVKV